MQTTTSGAALIWRGSMARQPPTPDLQIVLLHAGMLTDQHPATLEAWRAGMTPWPGLVPTAACSAATFLLNNYGPTTLRCFACSKHASIIYRPLRSGPYFMTRQRESTDWVDAAHLSRLRNGRG